MSSRGTAAMRSILMASASVALAGVAAPAFAQAAPSVASGPEAAAEQGKDIIVTGTRIARPDLQVASPVTVLGAQEIRFRQVNNAEDLLRELPSVRPNLGPAVNNGSDGSASVELRGIGTNRTLVLLDGRRIVPFGLDGVVDLNVIPTGVVERVDVVTGGASSTYGADAVAGVVNFITKKNFSGIDLATNYRITERGDARQYKAALTLGANLDDGRGNVTMAIGYSHRSPLLTTDRSIGAFPISSATGGFSGAAAAQVTIFASPTNAALGLGSSSFGAVVNPATGLLQPAVASDTYNSNINTYFQTPLSQWSAYTAGHYEISKHLDIYANGLFARNEARIQLASSATFGNIYNLALNNPYLPAGIRNQLCAGYDTDPLTAGIQPYTTAQCNTAAAVQGGPGTPGYIAIPVIAQRRFTELGARGNPVVSNVFQFQVGARGDLFAGLKYDVSGQFGETRQNQTRQNWGSFSRVQQALIAYRNAAGQAVCADTTNNCVPLNLFGPNGSITQDQLNFINLNALINRVIRQEVVTGSISGDLFGVTSPLADKPFAFSIGGEYRHMTARSTPDQASKIQGEVLGTGARIPDDYGAYSVKEAFGELIAPLVSDKPFVHSAQLEAGIRFSDYSTTGKSKTWKVGGTLEPIQGFKFRAMYQQAVRSPNISELFSSPVTSLGNLTVDPCAGPTPTAPAALCLATGAPAGSYGSIPQPTSGQIDTTTSGNRTLQVEKAYTYTLGGVFQPTFVPRLAITVDYYNIKVNNAITTPASGDVLNGCYSTSLNPSQTPNEYCALIQRNPLNGSLNASPSRLGVILTASNRGVIHTSGVDFGMTYKFNSTDFASRDIGSLSLSVTGTYLNYYRFQATPNSINRDCTGYYSTNCTNPRAKWKVNSRLTYSYGPVDVSLLWRRVGGVSLEPVSQSTAANPIPFSTPQTGGPNPATVLADFQHIKPYDYFDFAAHATLGSHLELTLSIENLFDKKPPLVGNGVGGTAFNGGNTFPTIYDVLGRTYAMGARFKF